VPKGLHYTSLSIVPPPTLETTVVSPMTYSRRHGGVDAVAISHAASAKLFIYEASKAGRESDEPATDLTAPTTRKPGG
jgi:hypothetical protein